MTGLAHSIVDGIERYAWTVFYASMILLALELIFPASRHSLRSRLRGAWFWVVYIVITVSLLAAYNMLWNRLGVAPLVRLDLGRPFQGLSGPVRWASWIALPIVTAVISEFFYYWFHRAQHAWPFLWRFHRVHHSIREMNAWNSVHHPTEEIFRIPFIGVPLALLGVSPGYIPALVLAILGMQGQFEHSCTRVHLGWFRYLVADNRYHRIHHSTDSRHFGKNFGSFTSVWDQLFGTAHFPARGEWPETGLADYPEARTLRHYVLATAAPRASAGAAHATRPRLDAAAPNR